MKIWMTFNPNCGTARNVLALLRDKGIEVEIREDRKQPLTRDDIATLVKQMGVPVKDIVRWKTRTRKSLLPALRRIRPTRRCWRRWRRIPVLLNWPIVRTPKGVKLCRPSETVVELI